MSTRRFNSLHLLLVVLVVALLGFFLDRARPVWLAPPNFQHTPLLYTLVAVLWIPVWSVGRALRPAPVGSVLKSVALVLRVVIILLGLYTLSSAGIQAVLWETLSPDTLSCSQGNLSDNRIQYTCTQNLMGGGYRFTLEGASGSAFAQLVNTELLVD